MKAQALKIELTAFLDYLGKERRYSESTVRAYRTDLLQTIDYLESENIDLAKAPPEVWIDYFGLLFAKGRAARTHARKVSSLKSFLKFLSRTGKLHRDRRPGLRSPKLPRTLPRYLTEDQAAQLVSRPKEGPKGDGRDRAILNLFYGGGLRLAEVSELKPVDVEFKTATVRVLGKGQKRALCRWVMWPLKQCVTTSGGGKRMAKWITMCHCSETGAGVHYRHGRSREW